mgnify:CR=1 FL=1
MERRRRPCHGSTVRRKEEGYAAIPRVSDAGKLEQPGKHFGWQLRLVVLQGGMLVNAECPGADFKPIEAIVMGMNKCHFVVAKRQQHTLDRIAAGFWRMNEQESESC